MMMLLLLLRFLARLVTGWSTALPLGKQSIDHLDSTDSAVVVLKFDFAASDESAAETGSGDEIAGHGPWRNLEGYDIA